MLRRLFFKSSNDEHTSQSSTLSEDEGSQIPSRANSLQEPVNQNTKKKYLKRHGSTGSKDEPSSSKPISIPRGANKCQQESELPVEIVGTSSSIDDDSFIENTKPTLLETRALSLIGLEITTQQGNALTRVNKVLPLVDYGIHHKTRVRNEQRYNNDAQYRRIQKTFFRKMEQIGTENVRAYDEAVNKVRDAFGRNVRDAYYNIKDNVPDCYDLLIQKMSLWARELSRDMSGHFEKTACYDMEAVYNLVCRMLGCRIADVDNVVKASQEIAKELIPKDVLDFEFGQSKELVTGNKNRFTVLQTDRTPTLVERVLAEFLAKPEIIVENLVFRDSVMSTQMKAVFGAAEDMQQLILANEKEDTEKRIIGIAELARLAGEPFPAMHTKCKIAAGPTSLSLEIEGDIHRGPLRALERNLAKEIEKKLQNEYNLHSLSKCSFDRTRLMTTRDIIYVHTSVDNNVELYLVLNTGGLTVLTQERHFRSSLPNICTTLQGVPYAKYSWNVDGLFEREYVDSEGNRFTANDKRVKAAYTNLAANQVDSPNDLMPAKKEDPIRNNIINSARRIQIAVKQTVKNELQSKNKYQELNQKVRCFISDREKIITESMHKENISTNCAPDILGTMQNNNEQHVMPTLSAISVLAGMVAKQDLSPRKTLYWTETHQTRMGNRDLHLAHICPCPNNNMRIKEGCGTDVRVYCNNTKLWNTVITLG